MLAFKEVANSSEFLRFLGLKTDEQLSVQAQTFLHELFGKHQGTVKQKIDEKIDEFHDTIEKQLNEVTEKSQRMKNDFSELKESLQQTIDSRMKEKATELDDLLKTYLEKLEKKVGQLEEQEKEVKSLFEEETKKMRDFVSSELAKAQESAEEYNSQCLEKVQQQLHIEMLRRVEVERQLIYEKGLAEGKKDEAHNSPEDIKTPEYSEQDDIIELNVGGFCTTVAKSTLTQHSPFFEAMFSGRFAKATMRYGGLIEILMIQRS